ncbi:Protein unc-13 C [Portunus trituberculatus]|uniref:Protein unc-13 C n=1 Tax=Portunus trituberculatus TaxID=210409 RepID=A0A5B7I6C8_PORTR|nr:Protein unc-13 C [Portunus trituberculatus]
MASSDSSMIKALLESQENSYRSAMEVVIKQIREKITKLESNIADITTSLEFNQREMDELKSTIKNHEKEIETNKAIMDKQISVIDACKSRIESLEERCNYMEDYSRRNNILITGVEERSGGETWEQTMAVVLFLLDDKMQLPGLDLKRAHRVGRRLDARPRPIVVHFSRYSDREAVMRNVRKLKGTNIYINDDLCAASQAVKNAQMPQFKEASARGKIAFFKHTKLIVKESSARRNNLQSDDESLNAEAEHPINQGEATLSTDDEGSLASTAAIAGGATAATMAEAGMDAGSGMGATGNGVEG